MGLPPCYCQKTGGSIRITVDYKRLNAVRIVGKWPLPRIDEVLDALGAGKLYSTFDLMSVFFRTPFTLTLLS